jgi:hypothetical protein
MKKKFATLPEAAEVLVSCGPLADSLQLCWQTELKTTY